MAHDYAKAFYNSAAWRKCSKGYMASKHYICERCGGLAEICHHKTYITPANIHDRSITLSWSNLEAVCRTCHQHEHYRDGDICAEGLAFDENGNLIQTPPFSEGAANPVRPSGPISKPLHEFPYRGRGLNIE